MLTRTGRQSRARFELLIRCAGRLGMERMTLSQGYSTDLHPTREQLREKNDRAVRAVRRLSRNGRILSAKAA